jgi:hypothetical protein
MRNITRIALCAALASCAGFGVARAQNAQSPRVGSRMSYNFDVRDPGIGAQADVPLASRLALYPSGAVYLVDQGSLYGLNADVKVKVARPLYVGGGLNIMHRSVQDVGNTDAGVNLLGGFEGRVGRRLHSFAEGRVILNDGSAFELGAGLSIIL